MNKKQKEIRQIITAGKRFVAREYNISHTLFMSRLEEDVQNSYWAIYASPQDKIKKVLGGRLGQEVYADKSDALERGKKLQSRGYETYLHPFSAYGGEDCQITPVILNSNKIYASYVLFHELFHIQAERKNFSLNITLEENFADAFAYNLQKQFFQDNPRMINRLSRINEEWAEYYKLLGGYLQNLENTLEENPRGKEEKLKEIKAHAKKQAKQFTPRYIIKEFQNPNFNNAFFLRVKIYSMAFSNAVDVLSQVDPHRYIHSRKDIRQLINKIKQNSL